MAEPFRFENSEEVVEKHFFVLLILGNHFRAKANVVVEGRDDFCEISRNNLDNYRLCSRQHIS